MYSSDFKVKEETNSYIKEFIERTIDRLIYIIYSNIYHMLSKNNLKLFRNMKILSNEEKKGNETRQKNLMSEFKLDYDYMNKYKLTDIEYIIDIILNKYTEEDFDNENININSYENNCDKNIKRKNTILLEEEKYNITNSKSIFKYLRNKKRINSLKLSSFRKSTKNQINNNNIINIKEKEKEISNDKNDKLIKYRRIKIKSGKNTSFSEDKKINFINDNKNKNTKKINNYINNISCKNGRNKNNSLYALGRTSDSFVSDGAASYEPAVLTIEHVLPQTVRDDSTWAKWWPDPEEREGWVHKIANLVPLTRPHNSEASNLDFDVKKKTYFTGRNGTTSYSLTTQVIKEADWKPLMVEHRQTMLLDVFREKWELSYDEEELKKETSAKGEKSKTQSPGVNLDKIRLAYWTYALPIIQKQNSHRGTFTNCGARKYSETWGYFGINGFHVSCTTGNDSAAVYFYMGNSDTDVNKNAFDLLMSHKGEIEDRLGVSLNWDRANNNKASWISYHLHGVSIMNEADWPRMAEFQAEWSDKICNTLLPYVLVEDEKTKRIREISDHLREWAANKNGINVAWHKCSPSYLRFTTDAMDAVIPDYDVLSGWDTKDHYFYEIRNTFSDKVYIQFAVNSKGLTAEEKQLYEKIYEIFPMGKHSENWSWRLHFKSSKVEIGENISKEAIFKGLDKCYLELLKFEQELISKLKEDDTE